MNLFVSQNYQLQRYRSTVIIYLGENPRRFVELIEIQCQPTIDTGDHQTSFSTSSITDESICEYFPSMNDRRSPVFMSDAEEDSLEN